jgi:cell division septal protein FtsQ
VLVYLPLISKVSLAIVAGVLVFAGYRAAASASFFQARSVDVSGTTRVSADEVKAIVRREVAQTGVWRADLDHISQDLKKIAWVREAVVSRVLPDGLRVRVTEREPRAIARTSNGKFVWVDDEAVHLGAASPTDQIFMRGLDEEGTAAARAQNKERVQKFLEMSHDWEARGVSRRVSEVNIQDVHDVRAQLAGDDSQIEVRLGREDFGHRLQKSLEELDRQRQTPRGAFITHLNWVSKGGEGGSYLVVGFSTNPQAPVVEEAGDESATAEKASDAKVNVKPRETRAVDVERARTNSARKPEARDKSAREDKDRQRKKEQDKKDKERKAEASREAKTESRPRRVG